MPERPFGSQETAAKAAQGSRNLGAQERKSEPGADRGDRSDPPSGSLIDAFVADRSPGRAMRIRNELRRLERVGAGLNLELLDTVRPELVRAAVERLHAGYAKQTAQSTMKAFRAFVRFSKEKQAITAEKAETLQEAAGAHVLNRDRTQSHSALFPQLIQECERFPEPRRSRDSALVALWAGTDLTWRRLASLRTEELETLSASDPRLAPWIARWLQARGDAPGVLLCKIVGNTSRPDESNREESLRGLVNQRLERVAPALSATEARTEAQASFRAWNRT